jgi:hypothetical protein
VRDKAFKALLVQAILLPCHLATGKSSTVVSFTSGAVAGAAATVASYPFDLLRTTLAAQGEPKVRQQCSIQGLSQLLLVTAP